MLLPLQRLLQWLLFVFVFFFYIDLIRTVVAFYCLFSLSASRGLDNKLKYQEVIRNVFVTGSLYEIFTQIMEVFVFLFWLVLLHNFVLTLLLIFLKKGKDS